MIKYIFLYPLNNYYSRRIICFLFCGSHVHACMIHYLSCLLSLKCVLLGIIAFACLSIQRIVLWDISMKLSINNCPDNYNVSWLGNRLILLHLTYYKSTLFQVMAVYRHANFGPALRLHLVSLGHSFMAAQLQESHYTYHHYCDYNASGTPHT